MGCCLCSHAKSEYKPLVCKRNGLTLHEHEERAKLIIKDKSGDGLSKSELTVLRELNSNMKVRKTISRPDASKLVNIFLLAVWPAIQEMWEQEKHKNIKLPPYELHVVSGNLLQPPLVRNIKLLDTCEGDKIRMTCELLYDGKPELDLILKGTKGSFVSEHMPSIKVDLHWLQLQFKVSIELRDRMKKCRLFLLDKPMIKWKLDIDVTNLHLPLHVDALLESRLSSIIASFNQENPKEINILPSIEEKRRICESKLSGIKMKSTKKGDESVPRFSAEDIQVIVDALHPGNFSNSSMVKKTRVANRTDRKGVNKLAEPAYFVSITCKEGAGTKSLEELRLESLKCSRSNFTRMPSLFYRNNPLHFYSEPRTTDASRPEAKFSDGSHVHIEESHDERRRNAGLMRKGSLRSYFVHRGSSAGK